MRTTRRSDSPLYKRHHQFFNGCTNPNSNAWHMYGARGIGMYAPWASLKIGFDNFEQWVYDNLGPIPFPGAIIRRKDSTKDVMPGNLEWSTRKVQGNNRRNTLYIKIGRKRQSLNSWCEELGLNSRTVWSRIHDYGMTPKRALGL